MQLTRRFSEAQYIEALESWSLLDLSDKVPLFTSPFGDVFFRAPDGFWWLDTLAGAVSRPWESAEQLQSELNTPDGRDQYLLAGLAIAADEAGMSLNDDQVYGFITPPALGGAVDLANVEVIDFVVGVNIAGQIHTQIANLSPGTPISGITLSE